ncbi:proteasome activator complex subunit 3-like isoform X1 [Aphis gossypii]|uniref:Proteasome activator PA28 C-terminal domain-containing protein n=2 Tax=Aphis gossypii TaxID=80765 RepID=A0A9P0NA95_APHGO|nr:proteasome activator complex subunit 3-like isoform X1 [Aphis gossypii]CAH1712827.1 unnamed protein product [Aphis gossypii]
MRAADSDNTIFDSFLSHIHLYTIHSRKTMDQTEAISKTKEFYEANKIDAERIIFQKIPERLVHLYELLNKPEFCIPINYKECKFDVTTITKLENNVKNYAEGETPHNIVPGQMIIPSNKNSTELFKIIKSNISQLIEDNSILRLWITLLIPKIEDGNNFGVSIQNTVLKLIRNIDSASKTYLDKWSRYCAYRGKLISKVVKYPFIEDYRVAIEEFDEKQHLDVSLILREIYFFNTVLYDVIIKNIEKIKNPRTSNIDCLY